jgi:hypothetical protein
MAESHLLGQEPLILLKGALLNGGITTGAYDALVNSGWSPNTIASTADYLGKWGLLRPATRAEAEIGLVYAFKDEAAFKAGQGMAEKQTGQIFGKAPMRPIAPTVSARASVPQPPASVSGARVTASARVPVSPAVSSFRRPHPLLRSLPAASTPKQSLKQLLKSKKARRQMSCSRRCAPNLGPPQPG